MNTSSKPPRGRTTAVKSQIDENLKRVYEHALNEEVPDRFKLLLEQLKNGVPPAAAQANTPTAGRSDQLHEATASFGDNIAEDAATEAVEHYSSMADAQQAAASGERRISGQSAARAFGAASETAE